MKTLRTDAQVFDAQQGNGGNAPFFDCVTANFARTLELELSDAIARLAEAQLDISIREQSVEQWKQRTLEAESALRDERFHFYQMGLKEARSITVLVHDLLGHSWNAFVSSAQDGARQACNRILKDIDKALAVCIDDDAMTTRSPEAPSVEQAK